MGKKIAAIVVTYNRLEMLKKVIEGIKNQTWHLDAIYIVNNSSTDGTAEWLAGQKGLTVIAQPNYGSSGGQYTGFKAVYDDGFEWLWVMDDDVVPERECLQYLATNRDETNIIRTPLRIKPDGMPYLNDTIVFNLKNPFKSIWGRILQEKDLLHEVIPATGITFEGPLIHRSIIEKIGLPEKKFFIYADDSEYFIRAEKNGAIPVIVRDARLHRQLMVTQSEHIFTWKHFYIIRNLIAIDVLHGNRAVRFLRPFGYLIKWLTRCRSIGNLISTFKAFFSGYFYKSEN